MTDWASKYGDTTALISDREHFSFRELALRMNQYSRWALSAGVQKGETIALMMSNRPEYFAIWLGLIQTGAIVALISPDLRPPAIAHSLKVASARRVIAASECADACAEGVGRLDDAIEMWVYGDALSGARRIDVAVSGQSGEPLAGTERRLVTHGDRALRILLRERPDCRRPPRSVIANLSSGATGLPASPV